MASLRLVCFLAMFASVPAAMSRDESSNAANPIRKVVSMLQAMQKRVAEEGEKEKELFERYQCYCKNSGGTLGASIAAAESKSPAVSSDIEQAEQQKVQMEHDLKQHQADRDDAKAAMSAASKLRQKEAGAFAAEKSEADSNIAAVHGAVAALEKGMVGGFLQTGGAQTLRRLALSKQDMSEGDRKELLAFLSDGEKSEYVPSSGEVTGILKEIGDDMEKSLAATSATEKEAIANYDALIAARTKEVSSLSESIETKTLRSGELAVSIIQMKNDLSETQAQLLADKKFLSELDGNCASKSSEFDERVQTRSAELAALADTIRMLSDDDALELFKKTLPSASASFVQVASVADHALASLKGAKGPQVDFIALAIRGKKIGFEKIISMIDNLIGTLKVEQTGDDNKRQYCGTQFDSAEDKHKGLQRAAADAETAIAAAEEGLSTVTEEIAAVEAGIKALDKSVADATEQRQKEHAEFTALIASDSAAKELIGIATNRLNKFYNSALYKAPPKRELSEDDRIVVNNGGTAPPTAAPGGIAGTGVTVMSQLSGAPPPPPATYGAYSKKSGESSSVVAMMGLLVKDLDKEMQEAQTQEKDSQGDYEQAMTDSAAKRAQDSKALTQKQSTKAELEQDLQSHSEAKASAGSEAMATAQFISSLHAECDWILQYFDTRKTARADEVSSLTNAKAILSGADFSLAQISRVRTESCPSTSLQCGLSKDAAGDTVFVPTDLPEPGTCVNVASQMPADGEFKICGPGTFSVSRMSCDRHDYKSVQFVHPNNEFTVSDCKTYKLGDYAAIRGYIGSASYTCDAAAR